MVISSAVLAIAGRVLAADPEPIEVLGIINAPLALVWGAWTTSDGLRSWLAPHAEIELRVGGLMRTNYNLNGVLGDEGTIENKVLAYEPERMISIQVVRAPATFPFKNAIKSMWTVLYFETAEGSRTRLRIVSLGFADDTESIKMREFFVRGNAYTLQQLQKRFL